LDSDDDDFEVGNNLLERDLAKMEKDEGLENTAEPESEKNKNTEEDPAETEKNTPEVDNNDKKDQVDVTEEEKTLPQKEDSIEKVAESNESNNIENKTTPTQDTEISDNKNQNDTNKEGEEENKEVNPNLWVDNKDWSSDDEDGWINPDNYDKLVLGKEEFDKEDAENKVGVFVMTSDFAMQNIILQIGIPLLAIDGYMIKRVKSYILECYTCWRLCRDTTKKFCPWCKYATLLRVTCSYNLNGDLVLYRKKNWKMNTRGQRYNIPNPKGGRKNDDLI